jgi:hypothetical protein
LFKSARRARPYGAAMFGSGHRDIAFDVDFANQDDAIDAQLPAGPVAAAVRHSGRAAVEAALRSFFAARSRVDGTVRMGVVFRCYFAERAR